MMGTYRSRVFEFEIKQAIVRCKYHVSSLAHMKMGNLFSNCIKNEEPDEEAIYEQLPDARQHERIFNNIYSMRAQIEKQGAKLEKVTAFEGRLMAMSLRIDILEKRLKFKDLLENLQMSAPHPAIDHYHCQGHQRTTSPYSQQASNDTMFLSASDMRQSERAASDTMVPPAISLRHPLD